MSKNQSLETRTITYRQCPYCSDEVQSRGLYAHVMNSRDDAHGDYRSVPEGFNPREAEIITREEEQVPDRRVRQESIQNWLYLCTLCGGLHRGEMGYKVHLAKVAGDDIHPPGVDIVDDYYVRIPADPDWEPTIPEDRIQDIVEREVEQPEDGLPPSEAVGGGGSGSGREGSQSGSIPIAELERLVDRFRGKGDAYDDVEEDVEKVIARHQ